MRFPDHPPIPPHGVVSDGQATFACLSKEEYLGNLSVDLTAISPFP